MLFLGCLFEREKEEIYLQKSKCGISNAANGFQWSVIDGLNENLDENVSIINVLPVGVFGLQYKDFILKDRTWQYGNAQNYEIGGINLPFIKQHQRYKKCRKLLQTIGDKKILIYSTYLPFLKAVAKLDKSYEVSLIVTDLPEYYDLGKVHLLKKWLRKRNNKKIHKYLQRVDKFVLLTEQMKESLQVGNRPYTVVEGICNADATHLYEAEEAQTGAEPQEEKIILYTGTLHKKFGIGNLLQAFEYMDNPCYRLWICGSGDMKENINQLSQKDGRIKFFGYIPKKKIETLQRQASVLVNPRPNDEAFTKYSFPSKTMEYMLSGKPVVMFKLDGIPDEYDAYLNYVPSGTASAFAATLTAVCQDEDKVFTEKARRAREFVLAEKSAKVQARKILDLMEK